MYSARHVVRTRMLMCECTVYASPQNVHNSAATDKEGVDKITLRRNGFGTSADALNKRVITSEYRCKKKEKKTAFFVQNTLLT